MLGERKTEEKPERRTQNDTEPKRYPEGRHLSRGGSGLSSSSGGGHDVESGSSLEPGGREEEEREEKGKLVQGHL